LNLAFSNFSKKSLTFNYESGNIGKIFFGGGVKDA